MFTSVVKKRFLNLNYKIISAHLLLIQVGRRVGLRRRDMSKPRVTATNCNGERMQDMFCYCVFQTAWIKRDTLVVHSLLIF